MPSAHPQVVSRRLEMPSLADATSFAGIAACHIGGMTLNKFAGLPSNLRSLGYKDATAQIRKRGKDAIMRLKRVKVLIIDEGKINDDA